MFWELPDEILNAVLFVLVGMEVLRLDISTSLLLSRLLAIIVTLVSRTLTVGLPVAIGGRHMGLSPWPPRRTHLGRPTWRHLSCAGLSIPAGDARDPFLR